MQAPEREHTRGDPNRPIRLYNVACPYCGTCFGQKVKRTKEHVIARKFVPRDQFDGQWNLILNACGPCNFRKSQLEGEVAAITMQPDGWGKHPNDDSQLAREAERRAVSVTNTRTGKPINVPEELLVIEAQIMPGLSLRTSFTSSPQLDEQTAHHLAWHHIVAFFYLFTFRRDTKLGRRWPGGFMPIAVVRESDWGNSLMRSFQDVIGPWSHRVHGVAASEYFRACIKKSPDTRALWAWALEWNRTFRVVGFVGNKDAAQSEAGRLAWPEAPVHRDGPDSSWSVRLEERLPADQDTLFRAPS